MIKQLCPNCALIVGYNRLSQHSNEAGAPRRNSEKCLYYSTTAALLVAVQGTRSRTSVTEYD